MNYFNRILYIYLILLKKIILIKISKEDLMK